ncbi:single-stranded DNA-binding protein [Peptococcus simiae]|uniref:single-stranded DNA-binding protein n=1 Tax=Peptococcus simiae TaxID=1643805 RepID=UPI00398003A8
MNNVNLIGRFTADPDLKYTKAGKAVVSFTLAVDRPFAGKEGKGEADFISCQAWGGAAESVAKFLHKGSRAAVTGYIKTDSYTDKNGVRRKSMQVVCNNVQFLDPIKEKGDQSKKEETLDKGASESTEKQPDTQEEIGTLSADGLFMDI